MSFNPNHITPVTLANYEEAFLLYVDEELTPEAKKAVEDFVQLHPALKEELVSLCATKLPPDAISFEHKDDLFADSMKVATVDESLLLYIDDELPAAEAKKIKAQLNNDAAFALQYSVLLKTKLDKDEQLTYPYKKELYRRTERRIAPVWLRVAAAVVLIAGAGTAAWLGMNNSKSLDTDVAVVAPKNAVQQTTPEQKQIEKPITNNKIKAVATTEKNTVSKTENRTALNTVVATKRVAKKIQRQTFSKPHTDVTNVIASNNLPVAKKADTATLQPNTAQKKLQKSLNNPVVTSDDTPTYVSIDAPAKTTVPDDAVATTDSERSGGSVKGFLRKATRFIERRTGIKAVNDNDELLVGAVALKL